MSFTVVIPARYASTRLPGKPLQDIAGKPMVQHVFERAKQSDAKRVIVATDDQRILDAVDDFQGEAVLTSVDHESGTDRLEEVVSILGLDDNEIIINVQGDEPLIPPAVINQLAANISANVKCQMATLVEKIETLDDVFNPNIVKVAVKRSGYAAYFSRAPIPYSRDHWAQENKQMPESISYLRHIGIYAYRVSLLKQFVKWQVSELEATERLEQLRALDNGVDIHVAEAIETIPAGVDTQTDLDHVRALLDKG